MNKISQDFNLIMQKARVDIDNAIKSWRKILTEFSGDNIEYAYAKGSALKKWETKIDYVPEISDLDIHIKLNHGKTLISNGPNAMDDSIKMNRMYEAEFKKIHRDYFHIPRPQLMVLNLYENDSNWIPPHPDDVFPMVGTPNIRNIYEIDPNFIRKIDFENLTKEDETIQKLPESLVDRTTLDFWTLLRRITWRVSPAPVRLLTQLSLLNSSSHDIWRWNRTSIVNYLIKFGFSNIADYYVNYYNIGWKLYYNDFKDTELFRQMIKSGYLVLKNCIDEANVLNKK